jgi:murein L,D-transpeptidase YcbB/YkuD
MIHLMLGETDEARGLVDKIDMSRHKEAKTRAMMAAIVGEAWARTGQAKRAIELLETFDPNDAAYADLKPQLLRARAFAYAWANNTKPMKQALRSLSAMNPQFLSGFITKKKNPMGVSPRGVHPMLEKEAFEMLMKSGAVPRKMEFKRG